MDKQTIIEDGHQFRDRLLHAIMSGDRVKMDQYTKNEAFLSMASGFYEKYVNERGS